MLHRFLIVSALNTVIDIAVFNLLFLFAENSKSVLVFSIIKAVAFTFAVTNSYIWNSRWTYRETNMASRNLGEFAHKFGRFYAVNLTSLALNVSAAAIAFYFVQDMFSSHFISSNLSALVGSLSGMVINYRGYKKVFSGI